MIAMQLNKNIHVYPTFYYKIQYTREIGNIWMAKISAKSCMKQSKKMFQQIRL